MKHKIFLLVIILSLILLSACDGETPPSPPPIDEKPTNIVDITPPTPPIDKKRGTSGNSLGVGEEITLEGSGITLRLNAVTEDSRCPTTVRCVHAGWVTVDISIEENGEQTSQFLLTLPADREDQNSEVVKDNLIIRLLEVRPYPNEPGTIEQDVYTVVLEIVE